MPITITVNNVHFVLRVVQINRTTECLMAMLLRLTDKRRLHGIEPPGIDVVVVKSEHFHVVSGQS